MKSLLTAIFAAALLAALPAWAHGGNGHGKHAEKEWKKAQKHWAKHHRKAHRGDDDDDDDDDRIVVRRHVHRAPPVVHHHFHPAPRVVHEHVVVAPPAPPPGVHVVMPNIYIPF